MADYIIGYDAEFRKLVESKVAEFSRGKMVDIAKKTLSETISKNVSGSSSRGSGGLSDPSTFLVTGLGQYGIAVYPWAAGQAHIYKGYTPPGGVFADMVEWGQWLDLGTFVRSGFRQKVKRGARPFIAEAQMKVDTLVEAELEAFLQSSF